MTEFLNHPIQHVDLSKNPDTRALMRAFSSASFQARALSSCTDVYRQMLADTETTIFLGLAGAMVPGGMRQIVVDLIQNHLVDVVVSTGANLFHDFFDA